MHIDNDDNNDNDDNSFCGNADRYLCRVFHSMGFH